MKQLLVGKLIPSFSQSFAYRLELLAPHVAEIKTGWRRLLDRLAPGRSEWQALTKLDIDNLYQTLRSGDFQGYKLALERQGQALARSDLPEEYAIASLGYFFEAVLPYVLGENPKNN